MLFLLSNNNKYNKEKMSFDPFNDNEHAKSLSLLSSSVSKDFFFYKMNIQPKVNTNNAQMNQATLEFLCDLIDKQSIYIQEIESKYKSLLEEYTFRKMIIENKQSILKSINQCTLNRFINKNYEQEQKIRELEKENAILKIEKKNFNMQSYQPITQPKQPKIKMPEENKTNINKQINRNLLSALNKVKKSKSKIGLYKNKENSKENLKKSEQIEHSYSLGSLHSISFTNKLSYRNCILK